MARKNQRPFLDRKSTVGVFVVVCFSTFSGMTYIQEIALLLFCGITMLICKKWRWALNVSITFAVMFLCDLFVVGRLSGPPQYAALLLCHVLRFLLPLFGAFYIVTKTSTVGQYISAFMAMHLPNVVIIPIAVMFRFVPTLTEEWQVITQAMRLRGMALSIKNVLRRPLYMLENMLVPFLLQSSAIVDEMSAAVMARGFDKDHPRSSFLEVKMKALDWIFVAVSVIVLVWNLLW